MKMARSAAFCFALLIVSPAGANRFRDNPDQVIDRGSRPDLEPIGELESTQDATDEAGHKGRRFGTAFLISPCLILTNAHVVYGDDLQPIQGKDYSMTFRAGVSPSAAFEGHTIATPIISGDRDMAGRNDWAVLRLASCIGARPQFGWFKKPEHSAKAYIGWPVEVLGYPGDRRRGELWAGSGKIEGIDKRTGKLMTSASTAPGQSGGAVLIRENGSVRVVGLYTAARRSASDTGAIEFDTYSAQVANLFEDTSEILDDPIIVFVIKEDEARLSAQSR